MRSGQLRLILEVGKKRHVVAGAMDWPGLDRWETSEDDAIAKLLLYVPRYVGVAGRAGLAASSSAERPITSWIIAWEIEDRAPRKTTASCNPGHRPRLCPPDGRHVTLL